MTSHTHTGSGSSGLQVPNQFPLVDPGALRLAVVGESPGLEESNWHWCAQGHGFSTRFWQGGVIAARDRCPLCGNAQIVSVPTPFVGPSGKLLDDLLREGGLPRERCFVGNCSQTQLRADEATPDNELVRAGLACLHADLARFKPHCVLLLGGLALACFKPGAGRITEWRGSLGIGFVACDESAQPLKIAPALHPAAVLREPKQTAMLRFDVARAIEEADSPTLELPERLYDVHLSFEQLLKELVKARHLPMVAMDLEGTVQSGVSVVGVATSPAHAFTVPFKHTNWRPVWSEDQERQLWSAIAALASEPTCLKVFHNAAYDCFVLRWLHGIRVATLGDTMLCWNVLYPELEKDLGLVASVLTRGEFWKRVGGAKGHAAADDHDRDTYCAQDCTRTLECLQSMLRVITPGQLAFYENQVALLEPALEMMHQGMGYDAAARDKMVAELQAEIHGLQGELDRLAGIPLPDFKTVAETVARKVKLAHCADWPDIVRHAKPSFAKPLR